MSAVVVNIHLGGLVVVQLLPDVGFILQNNYWSDLFKSETCGQKYLSYFCWLYPAKKLMRPLFKADSRWMWSKIFITKTKDKEKVHLWCEPSPCDQKYFLQTKRERQSSPLVCAESMWSKNKKKREKERKKEKKIKREKWVIVHLWCEPSPGLVRPSVVFVARRHFDIVVELDYLQK